MNVSEINDLRPANEFRGITFSKFKKTDVKKILDASLYNAKIEPACYWSAELICAGQYNDLWDSIIGFYSRHVHVGNPKVIMYIELRLNNFKSLLKNGYIGMELRLRNHEKIRGLFCEIMCVLCEAKRRHRFIEMKIKKEDFDLTQMTERFKAPHISFADDVFLKDDPKELFIAVNELSYNITEDVKDTVNACYWLEWIIEFDNICRQKKQQLKCERRVFPPVEPKFQMDVIWLVWDAFFVETEKRSNSLVEKLVNSALNIYCFNYTSACMKRRKTLMYFIIEIFTGQVSYDAEIVRDKEKLATICNNIDNIYKQIKANEVSPGTDYLYENIKASNLTSTMEKLELMNSLGADYIPRITDNYD